VWASDVEGVCPLDSDRDGLTNGEELGDPDCTWRRGDPRPDFPATHPSDPRDPDRCGDGVLHVGEDCDGDDLGAARCEDRGFLEGLLGCTDNCEYDDSLCVEFPEEDVGVPDADPMDAGMEDVPPDAAEPDAGDSDADATPLEDTSGGDATSDGGGTSPSQANPSDTGGCTTVAQAPVHPMPLFVLLVLLLALIGRRFGPPASSARWGHMRRYCVRVLPPR